MNDPATLQTWTTLMWERLESIPDLALIGELKQRWREHEADSQIKLVVFGAYDSGKSSLLKRLLVERGVSIPEWLSVGGGPQTFRQDSVDAGSVTIFDTPGISAGNEFHQNEALAQLQLADAFLWLIPPQLMTGERDVIVPVLDGSFFGSGLPPDAVTSALIVAISRMDEAGVDPAFATDAYRERCATKRAELAEALVKHGIGTPPRSIHTVAADPYQMVIDLADPEKDDYDAEAASWDGMAELAEEIEQLTSDLPRLRALAGARYVASASQSVAEALDTELTQREHARNSCANEIRRHEEWLERLEGLIAQAIGALRENLEEELLLAGARLFQASREEVEQIDESIDTCLREWWTQYDSKLDELIADTEAEIVRRASSPGGRYFRDLIEEASGGENRAAGTAHRAIGIMRRVAPAIRDGFRKYAEADLGMSLPQAARQLQQTKSAEALTKLRSASTYVKMDQIMNAVGPILEMAGELGEEWAEDAAEAERHRKRAELMEKLDARTEEIADAQTRAFEEGRAGGFRQWLEQRQLGLMESERILAGQIEEFSVIRRQLIDESV